MHATLCFLYPLTYGNDLCMHTCCIQQACNNTQLRLGQNGWRTLCTCQAGNFAGLASYALNSSLMATR